MKKVNLKDNRTIKRYSESFKLKVLREISEGRLTKREAASKYDLATGSIYFWMRKYNRLDLYNPSITIQMPQEKDEKKVLKARIKELESALVDARLSELKREADLLVALEELGYSSLSEFEKKQRPNRSKRQ